MTNVLDERIALDRLVEDLHVEGWCRPAERHLLYDLARTGPGEGVIVEIGSWKGLSTIYLAAGSKRAGRERITAVDLFDFSMPEFQSNVIRAGVADWIDPVVGASATVASEWDGRPIRLLFIDGDHAYDHVRRDFEAWGRWVVPGGTIVFHDALEPCLPDVSRYLDEVLLGREWTAQSVLFGAGLEARTTADSALMSCSMLVARKSAGGAAGDMAARVTGVGPFTALHQMMTRLREQQLIIQQLEMADPLVGRRIEREREQYARLRQYTDTIERQLLELEEEALEREASNDYALVLEERVRRLEQANDALALTNRVLDRALRKANPLKNRVRARLRRRA